MQQVIGGYLYYGRAVDDTILPALSAIASEQASATENTEKKSAETFELLGHSPRGQGTISCIRHGSQHTL